jgi:hypothetical protein
MMPHMRHFRMRVLAVRRERMALQQALTATAQHISQLIGRLEKMERRAAALSGQKPHESKPRPGFYDPAALKEADSEALPAEHAEHAPRAKRHKTGGPHRR